MDQTTEEEKRKIKEYTPSNKKKEDKKAQQLILESAKKEIANIFGNCSWHGGRQMNQKNEQTPVKETYNK